MKENQQSQKSIKNYNLHMESEIDVPDRFEYAPCLNTGCSLHSHRIIELYGVTHGSIGFNVRNENKILSDGQMVMVGSLECHSINLIETPVETYYIQVGSQYTEDVLRLYPNKLPPVWLMDAAYNSEFIYPFIATIQQRGKDMSILERIGIVNLIYAKIIERYGVRDFTGFNTGKVELNQIIQYIYDNYTEPITLNSLAHLFGYNPRVLSGKLSKVTGMDLRLFISDVRMQKVIMMCSDKENEGMSLLDIVSRCGFNSVASFYRAYKRAYNKDFLFSNFPIR